MDLITASTWPQLPPRRKYAVLSGRLTPIFILWWSPNARLLWKPEMVCHQCDIADAARFIMGRQLLCAAATTNDSQMTKALAGQMLYAARKI
jgi:hypothetical protein